MCRHQATVYHYPNDTRLVRTVSSDGARTTCDGNAYRILTVAGKNECRCASEYCRRWRVVFELVTSGVSDVRLEIHYSWYVDEVVMYPVHRRRSCVASWLFQAGSPKRLQQGRDAQVPAVLSADETRRSSLDHLKLVDAVYEGSKTVEAYSMIDRTMDW